jgi:hypothetical protein
MPDFNVRSDSVNVEQIMEQIRARIREKRGADYTEQQIQELAAVKLEKFLDPRGVRSDLLEQFRRAQPPYSPPELPNYAFEDVTLFESHRAPLRLMRKLLRPILKLFFNPNPLIQALNIQSRLNTLYAEREAKREAARHAFDQLHYEVMHNLVLETTRLGIEVKNLKMRVESLTSRLEFNERRARALESVVVYKPSPEDRVEPAPAREPRREEPVPVSREAGRPTMPGGQQPQQQQPEGPGQRSRRRRRRRGRRGGGGTASAMMAQAQGVPGQGSATQGDPAGVAQEPQGASDSGLEPYEAAHHEAPDLEPESPDEQDAGDADGHDGDQ